MLILSRCYRDNLFTPAICVHESAIMWKDGYAEPGRALLQIRVSDGLGSHVNHIPQLLLSH